MKRSAASLLVIGLALTASVFQPVSATAQQGPGSGQGGGRMLERFRMMDQNEDGVISADEAAARHESVFFIMDADDDGALTFEEYMAVRMGPGAGLNPTRQQAMQARKESRFKEMDTDSDEKVSKAEFMAGGKARYEASDTNEDGKVTVWEFRSQHRAF